MLLTAVWLLIIGVSLGFRTHDATRKENTTANVVASIAEKYDVKCATLLHSNNTAWEEKRRTFRIGKLLSEINNILKKTINVFTFQEYINFHSAQIWDDTCTKTLNIIYGYDNITKFQLEELSLKINMGRSMWIMFLSNGNTAQDVLEFVNLPFDSFFLTAKIGSEFHPVILGECYRVAIHHPIRILQFGLWTAEKGLMVRNRNRWRDPRNDLEGVNFKVGSTDNPPLTYFDENEKYVFNGLFALYWQDFQMYLNFTSSFIKHTSIGTFNGIKWNGMIGQMLKKEIDVIVAEVTITPRRNQVVDFLWPSIISRYHVYFKEQGFAIQWDGFLLPFHKNVWLAILLFLIGTALLLKVMHFKAIKSGFEDAQERKEYRLCQGLFVVISAFVQQGTPFQPNSGTCRIMLLITFLFSLLICTVYSSILTSFIMVQRPKRPFDSWEQFLRDGTYTMEQIPGSSDYFYFSEEHTSRVISESYESRHLTQDSRLRVEIYNNHFPKVQESELPRSHKQALENVCFKHKVAHLGIYGITDDEELLYKENGCKFVTFQKSLESVYVAFAVAKNSQYKNKFNYYFGKLLEMGQLHRYRTRRTTRMGVAPSENSFKPIVGEHVLQLHLILFVGIVASVSILTIEMYLKRCNSKNDFNRPELFQSRSKWERQLKKMKTTKRPYDALSNLHRKSI